MLKESHLEPGNALFRETVGAGDRKMLALELLQDGVED